MLGVTIGLAVFLGSLAWIAYVHATDATSTFSWMVSSMERSARRVGALSLLPGVGSAAGIIHCGVEPPASLIVGACLSLGVFALALTILKMEGLLSERDSDVFVRRLTHAPLPPSTTGSRVVWTLVGCALLGIAFFALHVVST